MVFYDQIHFMANCLHRDQPRSWGLNFSANLISSEFKINFELDDSLSKFPDSSASHSAHSRGIDTSSQNHPSDLEDPELNNHDENAKHASDLKVQN